jgi:NTE family protein
LDFHSGGGAKGFAHVGVLKVLDSLGVKVDYIWN